MDYESFKAEYSKLVKLMLSYSPEQVGSSIYAEKLADLSDAYPAFEAQLDEEI